MNTSGETRHAHEKDRRTRSFGCAGPFKVQKLARQPPVLFG